MFVDKSVYDSATLLLTSIKEVDELMIHLRAKQCEIKKWNSVLKRLDAIESRQAACIDLLQQDQEVLLKV